jgi:hypothetical protein
MEALMDKSSVNGNLKRIEKVNHQNGGSSS